MVLKKFFFLLQCYLKYRIQVLDPNHSRPQSGTMVLIFFLFQCYLKYLILVLYSNQDHSRPQSGNMVLIFFIF